MSAYAQEYWEFYNLAKVRLEYGVNDVEYDVKQYMVIVNDITHVDFSAKNCLNYFDFIE